MMVSTVQFRTLVVFVLIGIVSTVKYNRKQLQKKYPGFGSDFIIFPSETGEDIYGYFSDKGPQRSKIDFLNLNFLSVDISNALHFTLYTRDIPDGWLVDNIKELPKYLKNDTETKFITHGWLSGGTSNTCIEIKDAFLKKYDVNVFVLDWNAISGNLLYPIAMEATPKVGEEYAKFINSLIENGNVSPKDIHLIGHSLGAHVSGFAGRRTKGRVSRITGLDPAMPGFDIGLVKGGHLNDKDADFVDVIHTCAGFLGFRDPIGHVDFYPNGGSPPQPGCTILKFAEACSHGRSWKLFANSIKLDQPYLARKCQTFVNVLRAKCDGKYIPMGEPAPTTARGVYYVETTDEEPYLKDFVEPNKLEQ